MSHCIRVFSSHRWAYGEHRDGLHALLAPWRKGTDFVDLSAPETHPLHATATCQVARELVNRIRASHIVLVFAGMYANHSDWMKREIDWAFTHEKYIIPVIPHQQQRTSAVACDFGSCAPVRWRSDSIKGAILAGLTPMHREQFLISLRLQRTSSLRRTSNRPPSDAVRALLEPSTIPPRRLGLFD